MVHDISQGGYCPARHPLLSHGFRWSGKPTIRTGELARSGTVLRLKHAVRWSEESDLSWAMDCGSIEIVHQLRGGGTRER